MKESTIGGKQKKKKCSVNCGLVSERWRAADQLPGPALLSRSHQTDQHAAAIPGERRPHQAHRDGSHPGQVKLLCQESLQAATRGGKKRLTPATWRVRAGQVQAKN